LTIIGSYHDNRAQQMYQFGRQFITFHSDFMKAISNPTVNGAGAKQEVMYILRIFYECCLQSESVFKATGPALDYINKMLNVIKF
jgi:hypothetical protein